MSYELKIHKKRGIVILRYFGYFKTADADHALGAYFAHPDFVPGQSHFLDFSEITDFEPGYLKSLALQAKVADHILPTSNDTLLVILAPHRKAQELANMIRKSWEGVSSVVPVITATAEDALVVLGQKETSIAEFLATA